jgi:hypothetical protein
MRIDEIDGIIKLNPGDEKDSEISIYSPEDIIKNIIISVNNNQDCIIGILTTIRHGLFEVYFGLVKCLKGFD